MQQKGSFNPQYWQHSRLLHLRLVGVTLHCPLKKSTLTAMRPFLKFFDHLLLLRIVLYRHLRQYSQSDRAGVCTANLTGNDISSPLSRDSRKLTRNVKSNDAEISTDRNVAFSLTCLHTRSHVVDGGRPRLTMHVWTLYSNLAMRRRSNACEGGLSIAS